MTHKEHHQSQSEFFAKASKIYESLKRLHRGGGGGVYTQKPPHQKRNTQHHYKLKTRCYEQLCQFENLDKFRYLPNVRKAGLNRKKKIENPNGTESIKEIESVTKTLPSGDGEMWEKHSKVSATACRQGHTKVHCAISNTSVCLKFVEIRGHRGNFPHSKNSQTRWVHQ